MPTRWRPDLDDVPVDGALTLVVAWRRRAEVEGAMVPISDEVAEDLQGASSKTIDEIREREVVGYDPDAHLEREEWMAVPSRIVEAEASAVLDLLRRASALDRLSPDQIPKPLWSYAAVLGNTPNARASFVRKADPHKSAKPGRLITTLGDVLSRVEEPVFIFEDRFDLVVVDGGLLVLNMNAFELLFREAPTLVARSPQWVEEIAAVLPLEDDGAEQHRPDFEDIFN